MAGLLLVLVLLVGQLLGDERRLASTNSQVVVSGVALTVNPGKPLCQDQYVPGDAAGVRLYAAPKWVRTGGPVEVTIARDGRGVGRAVAPAFADGGPVDMELVRGLEREVRLARVCIVNRGPTPLQVAGNRTPVLYSPSNPLGQLLGDVARIDFLRPGSESWIDLAPRVATRFGLGKASVFGSWTLWAVLGALGALWAFTLRFLWRGLHGA